MQPGALPLLLVASALALAGCGGDGDDTEAGLSGKLSMDGVGSAYPFAQAAADQFQVEHPEVTIHVTQTQPVRGLERLCAGATGLVASRRPLADDLDRECPYLTYEQLRLDSGGLAEPLRLYTAERGIASALMEFISDHHVLIGEAAEDGRRAFGRSA